MSSPILIAIALVLLLAVVVRLVLPSGRSALFPYSLKAALFLPAERSFLGVLEQAVGGHYRIFGKVRIAYVVETRRGLTGSRPELRVKVLELAQRKLEPSLSQTQPLAPRSLAP